jgi:O-antigen/teichoic acid export membrane protein
MNPILIVRQQSAWLAASFLVQSLVSASAVLICLYLFQTGRSALFWGQWLGMSVSLVIPIALLGRSAWAPIDLSFLRKVGGVAPGAWLSRLLESARATLESTVIAKAVSGEALGNYNHARSYQSLLTQGTNAFANVLWPIALKEAQSKNSRFECIRTKWDLVYVGLTCVGIGAVFLGHEIVSVLTHGKFVQAADWLPWLVIYVLIQNSGKPATAWLYASKQGNRYSSIRILTMTMAALALILMVPAYGVKAVLAVAIGEMLVLRVCLGVAARRIGVVTFQDQWVVIGWLLIVLCWHAAGSIEMSILERCMAVVSLWCVIFAGFYFWLRMQTAPDLQGFDWKRFLRGQEVDKA